MDVESATDLAAGRIAAAIGEPARARMLYCLLDGHARTSTELGMVAGVGASTASVHLHRLQDANLVSVLAQGKHRYYRLRTPQVARVLENLGVLAGGHKRFVPNTPSRLRTARTCYDHAAGALGVLLHDRILALGWLSANPEGYGLTASGAGEFLAAGIDAEAARSARRRFAYPCLDWSERRPHLGGAIGAALLAYLLKRRWVVQEPDCRALLPTRAGRRELLAHFDIQI
ncbi:MAG: helix-turn-helix transcriptional regulator [Terracidiphilus sp.]